jgi:aspartate carbamoyltransferase catalytic subunit
MPSRAEALGVEVFDRLEPALEGADVVMMLRIQRERLQGALVPSTREYSRVRPQRGAPRARQARRHRDAPGADEPRRRDRPDVADGAASVILDQVEAGVAVRMATLWLLGVRPAEPKQPRG